MYMYNISELIEKYKVFQNSKTNLISLVYVILILIGMWKIFEKAGKEGWKSIIPIYNLYVYCQIVKLNFWLYLIAVLFLFIPILPITFFAALIYVIYFLFGLDFRLARAFGHGFWFGLGLVFFNPIFIIILGFNSDKYNPKKI